jgi:hypothetical protein
MAVVEIEIKQHRFVKLLQFMLAANPIPAPTLAILGPTRLLTRLRWQLPQLEAVAPGSTTPGTLNARATVTVTHVSLDELTANAAAPGTETTLTASLVVTADPTGLQITVSRLELAGAAPSVLTPALLVGRQLIPLDGVENIVGASVLHAPDAEIVTVRYSVVGPDDLLAPPANLLLSHEGDWLIRISGEVFADQVRAQLVDALDPAPSGTSVSRPAGALWLPSPLVPTLWGVYAGAEVEKKKACLDIDLSVEVRVTLSVTPMVDPVNADNSWVDLGLRIESDASDWDVARCWLTTGGVAALVLGLATNIAAGIMVAVKSLIAIAETVRIEAGSAVVGSTIGGGFTRTGGDATSATYSGRIDLPIFPTGSLRAAQVGPHGLVVHGDVAIEPPEHVVTFEPDGGTLPAKWNGSYDCEENRWEQSYDVGSIVVRDRLQLGPQVVPQRPAVTVFPTTTFRRAPGAVAAVSVALWPGIWVYDAPSFPHAAPIVTPRRTGPPPAGQHILFFLHTSAGLRRYEIGPVPGSPAEPSDMELAVHKVNCKQMMKLWTPVEQIQWLIDPPPFDYGYPPLRQWLLAFQHLGPRAIVRVFAAARDGSDRRLLAERDFREMPTGAIEVVTAADVELTVEHHIEGKTEGEEREPHVRVMQRWIVPTKMIPIDRDADVRALGATRSGQQIAALWNEHRVVGVAWGASSRARRQQLHAAAVAAGLGEDPMLG